MAATTSSPVLVSGKDESVGVRRLNVSPFPSFKLLTTAPDSILSIVNGSIVCVCVCVCVCMVRVSELCSGGSGSGGR